MSKVLKKRFQVLSRVSHLETKPEQHFWQEAKAKGQTREKQTSPEGLVASWEIGESLNDIPPHVSSTIQCSSWVTLIPWCGFQRANVKVKRAPSWEPWRNETRPGLLVDQPGTLRVVATRGELWGMAVLFFCVCLEHYAQRDSAKI